MILDLDYLREQLQKAELVPFPWTGEDKNLGAFRSKEELVEWYCQPPGVENQPYRDRAFYTRELAMLSRLMKPRRNVEFGTSLRIGTCILSWLNPTAQLTTVDVNTETFLPGDVRVPMGLLAKHNKIPCEYVTSNSWEYNATGVDLCFIDANHTYYPVAKDSERAWMNRSRDRIWAIAWHDYNDRHPGVVAAVNDFCERHEFKLSKLEDSDTVWLMGDT